MAELNLKSFIRILTFTYIVRINRFRNYISIRAYKTAKIVLSMPIEATIGFDYLWYIVKTGLNILKSFTATVPTLTYAVGIDRFRNYISTGAYSTTRIVLIIFIEATICFYRLWYIAKTGSNIWKSFITTSPTLTYVVKVDRFRNYISIEAYSVTRITLVISTEAIIYFDFL
jgi:hypothetical protein